MLCFENYLAHRAATQTQPYQTYLETRATSLEHKQFLILVKRGTVKQNSSLKTQRKAAVFWFSNFRVTLKGIAQKS